MNEEGLNELSRDFTKKINEELISIYQHSDTLVKKEMKKEDICCIKICVRKEGKGTIWGIDFIL